MLSIFFLRDKLMPNHRQISSSDQLASGVICVCMVAWRAVPETALNRPHVTVTLCTGITDLECNGTNHTWNQIEMNLFHQLHLFVYVLFVMFGTTVLHIMSVFCLHFKVFKKPRNVKLCRLLGQFMNPKIHNEVGPIGAGHNLHVHACEVRPLHSRTI